AVAPPVAPLASSPTTVAVAPARRGGCSCGSCLMVLVLLLVLLVLSGGSLYLAISNGVITQHQIMNAIGLGTGEISVANLSDETVTVTVTQLDSQTRQEADFNTAHTLKTLEIQEFTQIQPGIYKISIPRQGLGGG